MLRTSPRRRRRPRSIKSKILKNIWQKIKHHHSTKSSKSLFIEIISIFISLVLIISFLRLLANRSKANKPTNLKLMTFNLRNAALDQDYLDQNKHWSLRRNVINKILTNEQCDIIGIQEGIIAQVEDISISLHGLYGEYGNGRQPTEWYQSSMDIMNEKCSIFWKRETLSVYDYGTFWLSDEPNIAGSKYLDAALSRIATWSLLDIKDNSKYQILFISTHLVFVSDALKQTNQQI